MICQFDPNGWTNFFTHVGIPTGLLVFVLVGLALFIGKVVKNWFEKYVDDNNNKINRILDDAAQREKRMADRIDHLEEFNNTTLIEMVRDTRVALVESTNVIRDLHQSVISSNDSVKVLITQLTERPCLLQKNDPHEH